MSTIPVRQSSTRPWFWIAFTVMIIVLALFFGYLALSGAKQLAEHSLMQQDVFRIIIAGKPQHLNEEDTYALLPEFKASLDNELQRSVKTVHETIDQRMDTIFAHSLVHVPVFTDWYYSLPGEYSRYANALIGNMGSYLSDRLQATVFEPSGLMNNMNHLNSELNQQVARELQIGGINIADNLRQFLDNRAVTVDEDKASVNVRETVDLSTFIGESLSLSETDMGKLTVSTLAAVGIGTAIGKGLGAVVVKKVIAKVVGTESFQIATALLTKFAVKAAAKGGGAGVAAASGAAICSPGGPLAIGCGAIAGLVTWLAVDAVFIEFDEYLNRDTFEQDIHKAILHERDVLKNQLKTAYQQVIEHHYAQLSAQFQATLPGELRQDFVPSEQFNAAPAAE